MHERDHQEYLGAHYQGAAQTPPCPDCTPTCTCTRHLEIARQMRNSAGALPDDSADDAAIGAALDEAGARWRARQLDRDDRKTRRELAWSVLVCIAFCAGFVAGAASVWYSTR